MNKNFNVGDVVYHKSSSDVKWVIIGIRNRIHIRRVTDEGIPVKISCLPIELGNCK